MNKAPKRIGVVAALALTGTLLTGPAALAVPVTPLHAGHDHGPATDRPKPDRKDDHDHGHGHGKEHGHHGHRHDDDSAHASGGYDSHRHHPRDY